MSHKAQILEGFNLEHCMFALAPDMGSVLTTARGLNAFQTGLACVLPRDMVHKHMLLPHCVLRCVLASASVLSRPRRVLVVQNSARLEKYRARGFAFKCMFMGWCASPIASMLTGHAAADLPLCKA